MASDINIDRKYLGITYKTLVKYILHSHSSLKEESKNE
jgi:hypothetical protein